MGMNHGIKIKLLHKKTVCVNPSKFPLKLISSYVKLIKYHNILINLGDNMDSALFVRMHDDKHMLDLKKMKQKYSDAAVADFVEILHSYGYLKLPLKGFDGKPLVFMQYLPKINLTAAKALIRRSASETMTDREARELEIYSTLALDNIEVSMAGIGRVIDGQAPANDGERHAQCVQQAMEFVCNPDNKITQENMLKLYNMTASDFLDDKTRLQPGTKYRHDKVDKDHAVGVKSARTSITAETMEKYMEKMIEYMSTGDTTDELNKAAVIHYYIAYIHPWFYGNGRLARLMQIWYLVQHEWPRAAHIPFSSYIHSSRAKYQGAFDLIQQNARISGVVDITPFLIYYDQQVYSKLERPLPGSEPYEQYREL